MTDLAQGMHDWEKLRCRKGSDDENRISPCFPMAKTQATINQIKCKNDMRLMNREHWMSATDPSVACHYWQNMWKNFSDMLIHATLNSQASRIENTKFIHSFSPLEIWYHWLPSKCGRRMPPFKGRHVNPGNCLLVKIYQACQHHKLKWKVVYNSLMV